MASEMIPDIRSLVCTNSLHLLHVPRQPVGGKKYASRKDGGGQQAKMGGRRHMACYGGGHLLLLWLLGCPPPLLAAKIAFYVIRSFIHHTCFTSVMETHRKITFTPVRVI